MSSSSNEQCSLESQVKPDSSTSTIMSDEEDDEGGWSLTESDPLLFTHLLKDIGVQGLQVDDLYSLDDETLSSFQPIHALIFLFKWVNSASSDGGESTMDRTGKGGEIVGEDESFGVFYANQVINNSCGTLAALNAVMNIPPLEGESPAESIGHGAELGNLREFGVGMDPFSLGHAITNSDVIRQVHNSFSSSSPFSISQNPHAPKPAKQDAYHFISYVPVHGQLWELDGLQKGPIRHGVVPEGDDWVKEARKVIERRIETYPAGSLMFNLLCVRSTAIPRISRLLSSPTLPLHARLHLESQLSHEQSQERRGRLENGLRRHNLIPLAIELLQVMSRSQGQGGKSVLEVAKEGARVKGRERRAKGMEEDA